MLEPAINANTILQSIGRVHRLGQKERQEIDNLFVDHTFNRHVENNQAKKMISQIVGQGKGVFGEVIEQSKDTATAADDENEDSDRMPVPRTHWFFFPGVVHRLRISVCSAPRDLAAVQLHYDLRIVKSRKVYEAGLVEKPTLVTTQPCCWLPPVVFATGNLSGTSTQELASSSGERDALLGVDGENSGESNTSEIPEGFLTAKVQLQPSYTQRLNRK